MYIYSIRGVRECLIAYSDRVEAGINLYDYSFFLNPGTDVSLEGGGQISYGSNNVNGLDNPLFCNISSSNYTLAGNSPCLGSGQNGENIGAFDVGCGNVFKNYYVSVDAQENGNGSLDAPFMSIQNAINTVSDYDTILVSEGIYEENINYNGKNIVITGENKETTIIDGGGQGGGYFVNGEANTTI